MRSIRILCLLILVSFLPFLVVGTAYNGEPGSVNLCSDPTGTMITSSLMTDDYEDGEYTGWIAAKSVTASEWSVITMGASKWLRHSYSGSVSGHTDDNFFPFIAAQIDLSKDFSVEFLTSFDNGAVFGGQLQSNESGSWTAEPLGMLSDEESRFYVMSSYVDFNPVSVTAYKVNVTKSGSHYSGYVNDALILECDDSTVGVRYFGWVSRGWYGQSVTSYYDYVKLDGPAITLSTEDFGTDVFSSGTWTRSDSSVSVNIDDGYLHFASDSNYDDWAKWSKTFSVPFALEWRARLVSGGLGYYTPSLRLVNDQMSGPVDLHYLNDYGWRFGPTDFTSDPHPSGENEWWSMAVVIRGTTGDLYVKADGAEVWTLIGTSDWSGTVGTISESVTVSIFQMWDAVMDVDYISVSAVEQPPATAPICGLVTDEADSEPVGGVTIDLCAENGTLLQTTTTAANGSYRFYDLQQAGNYFVSMTPPAGAASHEATTKAAGPGEQVNFTMYWRRISIELTGAFDYLENEPIRIRITALLTDAESGETLSGATVWLTVYGPTSSSPLLNTLVSEYLPGVYVFTSANTIQSYGLQKGIYLVHVNASYPGGPSFCQILEFHIDPPGEATVSMYSLEVCAGTAGLVGLGSFVAGWRLRGRSRRTGGI